MRHLPMLAAIIASAFAAPATAQQQHMNMPGMTMPGGGAGKAMPRMDMHETKSNAPFRPGLGDLMTAFVQPHHIKLGLAGAARNWALAAYEVDELRESFDDAAKLILKHGPLSVPEAIKSTVAPPMDAVEAAIKAKDPTAFGKAYGELTAACNACHKSAEHGAIVIKVPDAGGTAFPDQDFSPQK
jgi:hypothetical protein